MALRVDLDSPLAGACFSDWISDGRIKRHLQNHLALHGVFWKCFCSDRLRIRLQCKLFLGCMLGGAKEAFGYYASIPL